MPSPFHSYRLLLWNKYTTPFAFWWRQPRDGCRIGIGGGLATSPLPHHRTDGARSRRFGGVSPRWEPRGRRGRPRPAQERPGRAPGPGDGCCARAPGRPGPCSRPTPGSPPGDAARETAAAPPASTHRRAAAAGSRTRGPGRRKALRRRLRRRPSRCGRAAGHSPAAPASPPGAGTATGAPPACPPSGPSRAPGAGAAEALGPARPETSAATGGPPLAWPPAPPVARAAPARASPGPPPAARRVRSGRRGCPRRRRVRPGAAVAPTPGRARPPGPRGGRDGRVGRSPRSAPSAAGGGGWSPLRRPHLPQRRRDAPVAPRGQAAGSPPPPGCGRSPGWTGGRRPRGHSDSAAGLTRPAAAPWPPGEHSASCRVLTPCPPRLGGADRAQARRCSASRSATAPCPAQAR
jgi:translation initiation factor IF-2